MLVIYIISKNEKSKTHTVEALFVGKNAFFKVKSNSGENYNVLVHLSCDCPYMGTQGIANRKLCSHILAVLEKVVDSGDYTVNAKRSDKAYSPEQ